MVDLVGTCPKGFWHEWIAEGDAAGEPESGQEWGWFTGHSYKSLIRPGDRFYVVAHGRLRGYSIVTGIWGGAIVRKGNAVACTIPEIIPGFRGLQKRWWPRESEIAFPDWKTAGVCMTPVKATPTTQASLFDSVASSASPSTTQSTTTG